MALARFRWVFTSLLLLRGGDLTYRYFASKWWYDSRRGVRTPSWRDVKNDSVRDAAANSAGRDCAKRCEKDKRKCEECYAQAGY